MDLQGLGLVVGGPLRGIGALAARAEAAGIAHVWVHEAGHDAVVAAAAIAAATDRVGIGTDVAVAFARTPVLAAFSAWDLQELSGGRFALGLGSQVRAIVEEGFGVPFTPPVARMASTCRSSRRPSRPCAGSRPRLMACTTAPPAPRHTPSPIPTGPRRRCCWPRSARP